MIVVCGEALIDLVPDDSSGQRWTAIPGGSPANAALAVSRLGVPSALLARLSRDSFGRRLRGHLASNGVDLSLAIDAAEPSTLAIVELDETGAASYRFDIHGTADWQWSDAELSHVLPPAVQAVHTGSMALTLPPGGLVLEGFLAGARDGHTISIDPNIRPSLGVDVADLRSMVARWCGLADIVKASSEDVEVLHPGDDLEAVARRWQALGPAVVIITLGADGALAVTAKDVHRLPAPPTVVVDTVAAGDTFTAGLLTSLYGAGVLGGRLDDLSDDLLLEAVRYGLRAAAITCSRAGADPPYLREMG